MKEFEELKDKILLEQAEVTMNHITYKMKDLTKDDIRNVLGLVNLIIPIIIPDNFAEISKNLDKKVLKENLSKDDIIMIDHIITCIIRLCFEE